MIEGRRPSGGTEPPPLTKRARIDAIREIAPAVFEVHARMIAPPRLAHVPGQYVTIRIGSTNETRSYSIASSPASSPASSTEADDTFMLLVRRIGGAGSQFLASLAVGELIELEGPRGDFRLAPGSGDAVFGATGVGVSALFPMIEQLLARPERGRVLLFWGVMQRSDLFWHDRLARFGHDSRFACRIVVTGEGEGFVTQPIVDTAGVLREPTYYLCGNGQMVKDVVDGLTSRGIDRARQIRTDWD